MGVAKLKGAALCAMLSLAAPTVAQQTRAAAIAPEPDAIAVQTTINALLRVIAELPASSAPQDVEAALAFALDQQRQPANVAVAAINHLLYRPGMARKVRAALLGVRASASRGARGTAAIAGDDRSLLMAGPAIGGGAVGATYSPRN